MRTARTVIPLVAVIALLSLAVPVFAQDTSPADAGTTGTEVSQLEPAVPIPPPAPEDTTEPWTYRYLVPTGLALALLAVFATIVQYFVRVVRSRYKLVR